MTKRKKSKKELARATLARVTKEMARPRFVESARSEEEAANHRARKLGRFMNILSTAHREGKQGFLFPREFVLEFARQLVNVRCFAK
jgi:alkylhydroperoxidase family enzyme